MNPLLKMIENWISVGKDRLDLDAREMKKLGAWHLR
jgi:hypothetical protein